MPTETIALAAKAHCIPPMAAFAADAPDRTSEAVWEDRIVTDMAVPMAPAAA